MKVVQNIETISVAMQIVAALVFIETVKWLVPYFMKKTVGTAYVTIQECEKCRASCALLRDKKNDELISLIKRTHTETKVTRMVVVRHLLRNGASPEELEKVLSDLAPEDLGKKI